jgi:uncharacterized protein (DUF2267 family)
MCELFEATRQHGIEEGKVERAVEAVLTTLQERIAGGLPNEALAKVPEEMRRRLESAPAHEPEVHERFDIDEFFRRVGAREQVDLPVAVEHARAVTTALCETLSESTLCGLRVHLPENYNALFTGDSYGDTRA